MTSRGMPTSRKFSVAGNLSHVASFAAATPGKLRSMASALFTPRGSAATPHPFPPPEEEVDPLKQASLKLIPRISFNFEGNVQYILDAFCLDYKHEYVNLPGDAD